VRIAVNRLHYPVTALGPGRRLGIWFQGCSLACPGCLSRDTWDPDSGTATTVLELCEVAAELCPGGPDGVTITGGEPFEQPRALGALVASLRSWAVRLARDIDILVYSGFPLERLLERHGDLLGQLDVLIPEPYVANEPPTGPWRGSGNQPLLILSPLGERRFGRLLEGQPSLQVHVEEGAVFLIGVPAPGDLQRLSTELRARGVLLGDVSWRP
jgi:anaerobic ribonucleoside-triphosphate reductase activating protein